MDVIWGLGLTKKVAMTRFTQVFPESVDPEMTRWEVAAAVNRFVAHCLTRLSVRVGKSDLVVDRDFGRHTATVCWDPVRAIGTGLVMFCEPDRREPRYHTVRNIHEPLIVATQRARLLWDGVSNQWREPEVGPAHQVVTYVLSGWNETQGRWVFGPENQLPQDRRQASGRLS